MSTRLFSRPVLFACLAHAARRYLLQSVLLSIVAGTPGVSLADSGLRSSSELDTRRIGQVSAAERGLLRLEWRSDISRLDEGSLVVDMLGRLTRIETTTGELHTLIRAMPDTDSPGAHTAANAITLAISAGLATVASHSQSRYALAGAIVLLLTFWTWRRHRATSQPIAKVSKVVVPPSVRVQRPPRIEQTSSTAASAEKIDALALASGLLASGLANDAAKVLQEHIRQHPKESMLHWMKLLEVYRKTGNRFQFERAARELKLNFNIEAENWAQLHREGEASLEEFGRINTRLQELWNQPAEALVYMRQLLADNRDGDRDGFPQSVAEDLMLLIAIVEQTSEPT